MGLYSHGGSYAGYDKNHKEREALDYYATPTEEVFNILKHLNINLDCTTILEPSAGGGHMVKGIEDYLRDQRQTAYIIATDIKERGNVADTMIQTGEKYDFLSEDYPHKYADYVIMNPPFSMVIPFVRHSLEIARKKVIMLGRLQVLEGIHRYEEIFKDYPATDVYVYIDRIACQKNGDFSEKANAIQAYAWYVWDVENPTPATVLHHIWRSSDGKK